MSSSKGTGIRYDNDLGGNHIQRLRDRPATMGVFLRFNQRFCEHCKQSKPKGKRPAIKGWKCDDCLKEGKK